MLFPTWPTQNCTFLQTLIGIQTSKILLERLQAYKHAVSYLEDYISTTDKMQKTHAKEYEKILKVSPQPSSLGSLAIPSVATLTIFRQCRTP